MQAVCPHAHACTGCVHAQACAVYVHAHALCTCMRKCVCMPVCMHVHRATLAKALIRELTV